MIDFNSIKTQATKVGEQYYKFSFTFGLKTINLFYNHADNSTLFIQNLPSYINGIKGAQDLITILNWVMIKMEKIEENPLYAKSLYKKYTIDKP